MRRLSLVFSFLVALLATGLLLTYAPRLVSGQRVYLDDPPPVAISDTIVSANFRTASFCALDCAILPCSTSPMLAVRRTWTI